MQTSAEKTQVDQEKTYRSRREEREAAQIDVGVLTSSLSDMDSLPPHETASSLRQAVLLRTQRNHGNAYVQRYLISQQIQKGQLLQPQGSSADVIQRKNGKKKGKSGGAGPGKIKGAKEVSYKVTGETLEDVSGQLNRFGGFACETHVSITIKARVKPVKKDDHYEIKVKWVTTDAKVNLPFWSDYNKACAPAQNEWDRFMGRARQHEQEAHVDAAKKFVEELGEEDTVITGETVEELQANLEAKQIELADRLQAIHDGCDHGASIDAILHPEKGVCKEEEEE